MAGKQATAGLLYKFVNIIAEELDREMPLTQLVAFARVALAGDAGLPQETLQNDMELSSASCSRTIQALSAIHYFKDRAGYDVVERLRDPMDNRKQNLKLTPRGEKLMAKLQAAIP